MKWLTRLHRAYSHKASIYRQSMLCSKKKSIGKHRRTSRHKYSMVFLHTKTFFVSWLNHQDVYNESWLQESLEKVFCPSVHIVQPGCLSSYTRWKPSVSRSCVSITREDSDSKQHTINLTFHFLAQSQGQIFRHPPSFLNPAVNLCNTTPFLTTQNLKRSKIMMIAYICENYDKVYKVM